MSVLICPPRPCDYRMCVIAERLGCLHLFAHARGYGHYMDAYTSCAVCFTSSSCSPLQVFFFKKKKLPIPCPEKLLFLRVRFDACFTPRWARNLHLVELKLFDTDSYEKSEAVIRPNYNNFLGWMDGWMDGWMETEATRNRKAKVISRLATAVT